MRYFPGSDITFELEHTDVDGILVNADTVTFKYQLNDEDEATATPTNVSSGKYTVILSPAKSGVLFGEWAYTKDGITGVKPDKVKIWPSRVQGV